MDTGRRSARPWVALAARAGYAAKGVVYALVGVLALQAAWYGSQTRGARGVLAEVAARPFGTALVAGIVVGLSCHAVWRFLQSVLDVDGLGRGVMFSPVCPPAPRARPRLAPLPRPPPRAAADARRSSG